MSFIVKVVTANGHVREVKPGRKAKFDTSLAGSTVSVIDLTTGFKLPSAKVRFEGKDIVLSFTKDGEEVETRLEGAADIAILKDAAPSPETDAGGVDNQEDNGGATVVSPVISVSNNKEAAGGLSGGAITLGILGLGGLGGLAAAAGGGSENQPAPPARDTTAPTAPTGLVLASADDTGSSNSDRLTSQATALTISGQAEAGSVVELFDGTTSLGTATANGSGAFSLDVSLSAGARSITAKARDAAGNTSDPSSALVITIDTTAPATTIGGIDISADTGSSNADFVTNTSAQTVTATLSAALAGGERLFGSVNNGSSWIDITDKVSGASVTWDGAALSGGSSIALEVRDAAGNSGVRATQAYTVDTTAPTAPTGLALASADDAGSSNSDRLTNQATALTISGQAEAGSVVELFDGTTSLGTATANGSGAFSLDVSLSAGARSITAKARDAAGNTSDPSSALVITVDTTAPTATIAMSDLALSAGETSLVTITFSEPVVDFALTDLSAPSGTLGALMSSDGGTTWTTTFTPNPLANSTTNAVLLSSSYVDRAGNSGAVASGPNYTADLVDQAFKVTVNGGTPPVITFSGSTVGLITVDVAANGAATFARGGFTAATAVSNIFESRIASTPSADEFSVVLSGNASNNNFTLGFSGSPTVSFSGSVGEGNNKVILNFDDPIAGVFDTRELGLNFSSLAGNRSELEFRFPDSARNLPDGDATQKDKITFTLDSNILGFAAYKVFAGNVEFSRADLVNGQIVQTSFLPSGISPQFSSGGIFSLSALIATGGILSLTDSATVTLQILPDQIDDLKAFLAAPSVFKLIGTAIQVEVLSVVGQTIIRTPLAVYSAADASVVTAGLEAISYSAFVNIDGGLIAGDYASLKALSDALKTIELVVGEDAEETSEKSGLFLLIDQLRSDYIADLSNSVGLLNKSINDLEQKIQGEGVDEADFTTLAALKSLIDDLSDASATASEDIAGLQTQITNIMNVTIADLQAQIDGINGEGDLVANLETLVELGNAVKALQDATTGEGGINDMLAGLQTQITNIMDRLNAQPRDWADFEGENAENVFTVADIFGTPGANGSSTVLNSFITSFAGRIEGYDPASVPLNVQGNLTVAQAVALAQAGLSVNTENVIYSIRDAYTTIQSALTNPQANAAMAGATEVVAFGNSNPNEIDMMAFGPSINLRIEAGAGNDIVSTGAGDHTVVGALGSDTVWLTPTEDDESIDTVVYQTIYDGQTLPVSRLTFSSDPEDYREGSVLSVTVNGTAYTYTTDADDTLATALQALATAITANDSVRGVLVIGSELEIFGEPGARLTINTGNTTDIDNPGLVTQWKVEFSDLSADYPQDDSLGGTFTFDRKVYITIAGVEVSASIQYDINGDPDPEATVAALRTQIVAEMAVGESLETILGSVTIEDNADDNAVVLVLNGKAVPLTDSDAPTFTVNSAAIDVPGEQQQTSVTFSSNNADYYEGGTLSVTLGVGADSFTITTPMVAGDALASVGALRDAVLTAIDDGGAPADLLETVEQSTSPTFSFLSAFAGQQWLYFPGGEKNSYTGIDTLQTAGRLYSFNQYFWSGQSVSVTAADLTAAGVVPVEQNVGENIIRYGSWNDFQAAWQAAFRRVMEDGDNSIAVTVEQVGNITHLTVTDTDLEFPPSSTEFAFKTRALFTELVFTAREETADPIQASARLEYHGEYQQATLNLNADATYDLRADGTDTPADREASIYYDGGFATLVITPTDGGDPITVSVAMDVDGADTAQALVNRIATLIDPDHNDFDEDLAALISGASRNGTSITLTAATPGKDTFSITDVRLDYQGVKQVATLSLEDDAQYATYTNGDGSDRGAQVYFGGGKVYLELATAAGTDGLWGTEDDATVVIDALMGEDYTATLANLEAAIEAEMIGEGSLVDILESVDSEGGLLTLTAAQPGDHTFNINDVRLDYEGVTQIATIALDSAGRYTDYTSDVLGDAAATRGAEVYFDGGKVYATIVPRVADGEGGYTDGEPVVIEALMVDGDAAATAQNLVDAINLAAADGGPLFGVIAVGGATLDVNVTELRSTFVGTIPNGAQWIGGGATRTYSPSVIADQLDAYGGFTVLDASLNGNTFNTSVRYTSLTDWAIDAQAYWRLSDASATVSYNAGTGVLTVTTTEYVGQLGIPVLRFAEVIVDTEITLEAAAPGVEMFRVDDVRMDYAGVRQIATVELDDANDWDKYSFADDDGNAVSIRAGAEPATYWTGGKVYMTIVGAGIDGILGNEDDVEVTVSTDLVAGDRTATLTNLVSAINAATGTGEGLEGIIATNGASLSDGVITITAAADGEESFRVSDVRMDYQGLKQIAEVDYNDFINTNLDGIDYFTGGKLSVTVTPKVEGQIIDGIHIGAAGGDNTTVYQTVEFVQDGVTYRVQFFGTDFVGNPSPASDSGFHSAAKLVDSNWVLYTGADTAAKLTALAADLGASSVTITQGIDTFGEITSLYASLIIAGATDAITDVAQVKFAFDGSPGLTRDPNAFSDNIALTAGTTSVARPSPSVELGLVNGAPVLIEASMVDGNDVDTDPDAAGSIAALVAAIQAEIDGTEQSSSSATAASVSIGASLQGSSVLLDIGSSSGSSFELSFFLRDGGTLTDFRALAVVTDHSDIHMYAYMDGTPINISGSPSMYSNFIFGDLTVSTFITFLNNNLASVGEGGAGLVIGFNEEDGALTITSTDAGAGIEVGAKVSQDDGDAILIDTNTEPGGYFTDTGTDAIEGNAPGRLAGIISAVSESGGVITLTSADNVKQQFTVTAATASDPGRVEITDVSFSSDDADYFVTGNDPDGTVGRVSLTVGGATYVVTMAETVEATMLKLVNALTNGQNSEGEGAEIHPDGLTVAALTAADFTWSGSTFTFTGVEDGEGLNISGAQSVDGVKQVLTIDLSGDSDDDFIAGIGQDISVTISGVTFELDGNTRLEVLEDLEDQLLAAIADNTGGIADNLQAGGVVLDPNALTLTLTARYGEVDPLGTFSGDPLTGPSLTRPTVDADGTNSFQVLDLVFTNSYLNGLTAGEELELQLGKTTASYIVQAGDGQAQILSGLTEALNAQLLVGTATLNAATRTITVTAAQFGSNVLGTVSEDELINPVRLTTDAVEVGPGFLADEVTPGAVTWDFDNLDTVGSVLETTEGVVVIESDPLIRDSDDVPGDIVTTQVAKYQTEEGVDYTNPGFGEGDDSGFFGDAAIMGNVDGEGGFNDLGIRQTFTNPDDGYDAVSGQALNNAGTTNSGVSDFFGDAPIIGEFDGVVTGNLKVLRLSFNAPLPALTLPTNTVDPGAIAYQVNFNIGGVVYNVNKNYDQNPLPTLGSLLDELNATFVGIAEFNIVQPGWNNSPWGLDVTMLDTTVINAGSFIFVSSPRAFAGSDRILLQGINRGAVSIGFGSFGDGEFNDLGIRQTFTNPGDDYVATSGSVTGGAGGEGDLDFYGDADSINGENFTNDGIRQTFTNPDGSYTSVSGSPETGEDGVGQSALFGDAAIIGNIDGEGSFNGLGILQNFTNPGNGYVMENAGSPTSGEADGEGDASLYGSDPGYYLDDGLYTTWLSDGIVTQPNADADGRGLYVGGNLSSKININDEVNIGDEYVTEDLPVPTDPNKEGFAAFDWDEATLQRLSLGNTQPDVIYNFQIDHDLIGLEASLRDSTLEGSVQYLEATVTLVPISRIVTGTSADDISVSRGSTAVYDFGSIDLTQPFSLVPTRGDKILFNLLDSPTSWTRQGNYKVTETQFDNVEDFVNHVFSTNNWGTGTQDPTWSVNGSVLTFTAPDGYAFATDQVYGLTSNGVRSEVGDFDLSLNEFGLVEAENSTLGVEDIDDADDVAALLSSMFDLSATTDNGELNTSIFAVTASDDPNVTAIWAHKQSASNDNTIDALELYLLATVNTLPGEAFEEFRLENFSVLQSQSVL